MKGPSTLALTLKIFHLNMISNTELNQNIINICTPLYVRIFDPFSHLKSIQCGVFINYTTAFCFVS